MDNGTRALKYVEESVVEDAVLTAARERANELGAAPITPATGAILSMFAQLSGARKILEVGTGAGVSGLWLLDGMRDGGTLVTIDAEPEHQRAARQAFTAAKIPGPRTRLINSRAQDVLPRMADSEYDLVFIDATPNDHPHYVEHGVRLLRPGGLIVLHNALLNGRVADAGQKDATTLAVRAAAQAIAEDDRLTKVLIPLGDGLLCATRG